MVRDSDHFDIFFSPHQPRHPSWSRPLPKILLFYDLSHIPVPYFYDYHNTSQSTLSWYWCCAQFPFWSTPCRESRVPGRICQPDTILYVSLLTRIKEGGKIGKNGEKSVEEIDAGGAAIPPNQSSPLPWKWCDTVDVKEGGKRSIASHRESTIFFPFPPPLSPLSILHHIKASVNPRTHSPQKNTQEIDWLIDSGRESRTKITTGDLFFILFLFCLSVHQSIGALYSYSVSGVDVLVDA